MKELLIKEIQKQFEENSSWTKIELEKTEILRNFYKKDDQQTSKPRKNSLIDPEVELKELFCLKLHSAALNTDIYVITDHSTQNILLE